MSYKLQENLCFMPTPAGAYRAVSSPRPDPACLFLQRILRCEQSPRLTRQTLETLTGLSGDDASTLLYHAQNAGWVEGCETEQFAPAGQLDNLLPELLPPLSSSGKVVLADPQGFYVCATGYPHEAAEELAALSASLGDLHERNAGLLQGNLRLGTSAWAVVDSAGNSRVGFWPIHIGANRFVLVVGDMPHLNQPAATRLLWALSLRYGRAES